MYNQNNGFRRRPMPSGNRVAAGARVEYSAGSKSESVQRPRDSDQDGWSGRPARKYAEICNFICNI